MQSPYEVIAEDIDTVLQAYMDFASEMNRVGAFNEELLAAWNRKNELLAAIFQHHGWNEYEFDDETSARVGRLTA